MTSKISLDEIRKILKNHEKELKKKYGVKRIGLFGSYVRGEQKEGTSDLDVLVEFRPGAKVSLLDFVEMENYLSDLLGIKVDLVEKSTLKPRIGKRVLGEIVYPW